MEPAIRTPSELLAQLSTAMNARDLAALVECFDPELWRSAIEPRCCFTAAP